MEPEETKKQIPQTQQMIFNTPVQFSYANGVVVGVGHADLQLTFSLNGRATNIVGLSHSVAKGLALSLAKAISDYEVKTDIIIPDPNSIAESLRKP
jgi:hypothetical protein